MSERRSLTPEEYAREIVNRWWEPSNEDDLPALIASVLRRALADREAELLAPAAGGEVTPEEVDALGRLAAPSPPPPRDSDAGRLGALCAEVRRLWAVLGDVAQDSAMYRHGFAAGWRACRGAAAARLEREAAGCAQNLAALDAGARPAGDGPEAFVEAACRNTCARLAARIRATEPPAEGGAG